MELKEYKVNLNNSGGVFWIGRRDFEKLFAEGWYINPDCTPPAYDDANYLGSGVPFCWLHDLRVKAVSMQAAVESFEHITGEDFFAEGCNCCGAPFSIEEVDGDERTGGDYVDHPAQRPF